MSGSTSGSVRGSRQFLHSRNNAKGVSRLSTRLSAVYAYNVNIALGNVLRKYREGRGFTQDEFAAYCGLSRAYYGRIERGEHSLTIEKCQKIATTLNVRLADLFGELQE